MQTASVNPPCLPQTISIPIVDDTLVEPREVFTVTLSSPSGAMLSPTFSTATVTIIDNDVSGSKLMQRNVCKQGVGAPAVGKALMGKPTTTQQHILL